MLTLTWGWSVTFIVTGQQESQGVLLTTGTVIRMFSVLTLTWGWSVTVIVSGQQESQGVLLTTGTVIRMFSVLTLTWGWSVTVIVTGQQVSGSSFNNRHCDQNVQCANINVGMVSGQQESGRVGLTTAAVITVVHNTNMWMITVTCEQEIGHFNNLCSLHLPLCVYVCVCV